MEIHCPACNKKQHDAGKESVCSACGCSPMPSYKYKEDNWLHPVNCDCAIRVEEPILSNRKTEIPTLATLLNPF